MVLATLLAPLLLSQERTPIPPSAPAAAASVSGRILQSDGAPVLDAPVVLRTSIFPRLLELPFCRSAFAPPKLPLLTRPTTTDASGAFHFDGLDPDQSYVLEVDLGPSGVRSKSLDPDDRVGNAAFPGDWQLSSTRELTGVLVDADTGAPIAGARVNLHDDLLGSSALDPELISAGCALLYRAEVGETVWSPPPWLVRLLRAGATIDTRELASAARTAADGSFKVSIVAETLGDAVLTTDVPGRPRITLGVEDDSASLGTLPLEPPRKARIHVVDTDRSSVAKAEVLLGASREKAFVPDSPPGEPEEEGESGENEAEAEESFGLFPVALAPVGSTDADGNLQVAIPSSGPIWIAVRAPGRADWTTARITERVDPIEIALPQPLSLDVRLVDADGSPLEGEVACIGLPAIGPCSDLEALLPILAPNPLSPGVIRTQSGSAHIGGLQKGAHYVLARAPGHALSAVALQPELSPKLASIPLCPLEDRSVRVVSLFDGAERPIIGAKVKWETRTPDEGVLPDQGIAVTDADGWLKLEAAEGAALSVIVDHPGLVVHPIQVDASDVDAKVVVEQGGSIAGRVHRSGKGLEQAVNVTLDPKGQSSEAHLPLAAAASTPDGIFRFDGIPPGSYTLRVSRLGLLAGFDPDGSEPANAERDVVVEASKTAEIEIDLTPATVTPDPDSARVAGTAVVWGTRPSLEAWLDGPSGSPRKTRFRSRQFDGDGEFDFGPVPPGEYLLNLRIDVPEKGYADLAEREISIAPREDARFDFELDLGGPLTGIVRSRSTDEPIAQANVRLCALRPGDPAESDAWRFDDAQETSADGSFAWSAVPSGSHWLRIISYGHVTFYTRIEVLAGSPVDLGTIALPQGPSVAGRVVDSASGTARCMRFEFLSLPAVRPPRFWLKFDAAHALVDAQSGAFSTRELLPGRYVVHLEEQEADDLPFRPLTIDVPASGVLDLELRFEPE